MVLAHNQLGVDEDIAAENQSRDTTVDQLGSGAIGEEHHHDAHQDECPESAEEVGHPTGEVIFTLACKSSQEDEDSAGEDDSVEDDVGLVEGDDDGDGVRLEEGEAGEEEEIGRVGVALPVGEDHEDHSAD